ncbi:MAG: helix-hairpin-helix domain-containing protein [Candidatus Dormibacteria bacterium]
MVSNDDVASILERVADLLEIRGDNAFKIRAYRLAAGQVRNLTRELSDIAAAGELRHIDGFGAAIADKVEELVGSGRLHYLEELEAEVPPTLLELRALSGVGPRTAAMLWRDAGITTVAELDARARSGSLAGLPRLGPKSIEKIIATLDERRDSGAPRRRPRAEVAPLVADLLGALRAQPHTLRAEVAGSYRRGRDTVGDLDVLAATTDAAATLSAFAALPQAERVLLRGETKCSIVVGGLQVDCRALPLESFGAAWQYFTGSQAHNVRLRGRALRLGMTLNEYGVFRLDDGSRVAGAGEEEVYAALGLAWIPPERREDRGEIEAAVLTSDPVLAVASSSRRRQEV